MEKIQDCIKNAKTIAVLSHIDEDCDAVGSSLAMLEILKSLKKDATCFISSPIEHRLEFLGNDLIVYDENVHQKGYDLVICLDSAELKRLGKRAKLLESAKMTVNIDHHYTNTKYADYNFVRGEVSSTGELVYDLCQYLCVPTTKEIAKFLYCAIMSDTGCLKYSSTSPKTVMTVAKLMETGINHAELCRLIFDTETINAIKVKGYIMNNIKSFYDGKLSLVSVGEDVFSKYNVSEKDVGDIVNIPRSVEGTQIAVSLRKVGEKIKVSFRSNGVYNVSEIASKIGGGGHMMAAGALLEGSSLEDAEENIIKIVGEVING